MAAMQGHDWTQKSDEELTAALQSDDPDDGKRALEVLAEKHQEKLAAYMRAKMPQDWVDEAVQNTWQSFMTNVRRGETIGNVGSLLWTHAERRRADVVRKLTAERRIEHNRHPLDTAYDDDTRGFQADVGLERKLEEYEVNLYRGSIGRMAQQASFIDTLLSDCQRVLWTLRVMHAYPPKTVARLMGKTIGVVYTETSEARKVVWDYGNSEEFELAGAGQAPEAPWLPNALPISATVIERFAEPALPRLTPDELKPLGLTNQELQQHYQASLMLPRWYDGAGDLVPTPPFLVLTRRPDWEQMQTLFARLKRDPADLPDEFPEEALIRVDVEADYIHLRVEPIHQMVPDDPEFSLEPDTYVAVHASHLRLPVILGAYSRSLYTPELRQRWPFANPDDIPD